MKFQHKNFSSCLTEHDKEHIHSHIEFNSVNLDCDGKFNNFKDSAFVLQEMSDSLCREYGLSVIENPKEKGQRYGEQAAAKRGRSFKENLRIVIENALPDSKDFEDFLGKLRDAGYKVKHGKYIAFRAEDQQCFTRSKTLGEAYTEEALRERIGGGKAHSDTTDVHSVTGRINTDTTKKPRNNSYKEVNLLVDIKTKMQAGKGAGYEHWAKLFNLKEAAKTLTFLIENGITDYDEMVQKTEEVGKKFDMLSDEIKKLEKRMGEVAQLKYHIINYSKTRDVYAAYKKSRNKKEFHAEHEVELEKHKAAKVAFNALGGERIPKVAQLSKDYNELLSEKNVVYDEYKELREKMVDFQTAKQNIDRILEFKQQSKYEMTNQVQDR